MTDVMPQSLLMSPDVPTQSEMEAERKVKVEAELIARLASDPSQFSAVASYINSNCFYSEPSMLAFQVMEEIAEQGGVITRAALKEGMLHGWMHEPAVLRFLRTLTPRRADPARVLILAKEVRTFAFNWQVKVIAQRLGMMAENNKRAEMLLAYARLQEQFSKLAALTPQSADEDFSGDPGLYARQAGCALYRWFDAQGRLLYVGITGKLHVRQDSHSVRSSWSEFASDCQVTRYPSKDLALAAETAAIKAEHPLFNKVHNDTSQARQALVDYLVSKGRTDLLTASLSRG